MRLIFILLLTVIIVLAFIAASQAGYLGFLKDASTRTADAIAPGTPGGGAVLPSLPSPSTMPTLTATPTSLPSATPTPEPSPTPTAVMPTPIGQNGHWTLIFNDEFAGSSLDLTKWTPCYWWADNGCTNGSSHELEWYRPENVLVQDGLLRLRAQEQSFSASDGKTHPYTSGLVSTGRDTEDTSAPVRFAFQYGYTEIRARVPAGKGLWPAFWMLPVTQKSLPEIDIMEVLGHQPDTVEMHIHLKDSQGKEIDEGNNWQGADFSSDWHVFALDWQPDAIVWYIDGVERWRFSEPASIPSEPMYLILNLAVGGTWPGNPDASTPFPSDFAIDYIRVWSHR